MVATGSFVSGHHRDILGMADVLSTTGNTSGPRISQRHCKKDIIVKSNDIYEIVENFIKVAHGPDALENNRARVNARENIRKKLALEEAKEKGDSCDLQICFMNEFASDEDIPEAKEDNKSAAVAAAEIVKANISQKVSQIIVPISPSVKQNTPKCATLNTPQDETKSKFQLEVGRLQKCAQEGLMKAREKATSFQEA
jgi:hypothetical protein